MQMERFVGLSRAPYAWRMTSIASVRLPIDWTSLGWPAEPSLAAITLSTGDPAWGWTPAAPAFGIHTLQPADGQPVEGFAVDHVVMLVPELEAAISTLSRVDLEPRLRMAVSGRPAAFFRAGTVLEVIEAPVREASIYGLALTAHESLEVLSLAWKGRGLDVGSIKPAIQPGRRIMTVRGLDAGLAVMSEDGAVSTET
jgi:hypothetical protein